jgi:hypothetical protein
MSLNLFDWFCEEEYGEKKRDELLSEVQVAIKQHGNSNMVYNICNSFILRLQEDHPQIVTRRGYREDFALGLEYLVEQGIILV